MLTLTYTEAFAVWSIRAGEQMKAYQRARVDLQHVLSRSIGEFNGVAQAPNGPADMELALNKVEAAAKRFLAAVQQLTVPTIPEAKGGDTDGTN